MRIASCVSASTPRVTRTSTRRDARARGELRLVRRVEHDRRADRRRRVEERLVLVVAVDDELVAVEPGRAGERELARRGDVGADALLAQQPQQRDVGERLRPEDDAPVVADGRAERARTARASVSSQ